jgi:hypothetical protein
MTDSLRDRIAAVQSEHQARANSCLCGWKYDPIVDDSHFDHVADAVIAALNLSTPVEYLSVDGKRRNWMVAGHYTMEVVTEWENDD